MVKKQASARGRKPLGEHEKLSRKVVRIHADLEKLKEESKTLLSAEEPQMVGPGRRPLTNEEKIERLAKKYDQAVEELRSFEKRNRTEPADITKPVDTSSTAGSGRVGRPEASQLVKLSREIRRLETLINGIKLEPERRLKSTTRSKGRPTKTKTERIYPYQEKVDLLKQQVTEIENNLSLVEEKRWTIDKLRYRRRVVKDTKGEDSRNYKIVSSKIRRAEEELADLKLQEEANELQELAKDKGDPKKYLELADQLRSHRESLAQVVIIEEQLLKELSKIRRGKADKEKAVAALEKKLRKVK